MKPLTRPHLTIGSILLLLGLGFGLSIPLRSAENQEGTGMKGSPMMQKCKEMMGQRQKMMETVKAQDSQLSQMVTELKSASRDQKIDLMAGILTKMVEQRQATHQRMEAMQARMMRHMMEHMQMSKDSMMQCPMLNQQGMSNTDESSAAHQGHHSEQK